MMSSVRGPNQKQFATCCWVAIDPNNFRLAAKRRSVLFDVRVSHAGEVAAHARAALQQAQSDLQAVNDVINATWQKNGRTSFLDLSNPIVP